MKRLIIECGGTTCREAYVNNGKVIHEKKLNGYSPVVKMPFPLFSPLEIDELWYFGTACTAVYESKIKKSLHKQFPNSQLYVNSDSYASAWALCGNQSGYVNIMGTGSSLVYWDGKQIVADKKSNLGYLWEDYASGFHIGKTIIRYWNEQLLCSEEEIILNRALGPLPDFIASVYDAPSQKSKISSISLLFQQLNMDTQNSIMTYCVEKYIDRYLSKDLLHVPHHFVGSIAYLWSEYLQEEWKKRTLQIGVFTQNSYDQLLERFKNNECPKK